MLIQFIKEIAFEINRNEEIADAHSKKKYLSFLLSSSFFFFAMKSVIKLAHEPRT